MVLYGLEKVFMLWYAYNVSYEYQNSAWGQQGTTFPIV